MMKTVIVFALIVFSAAFAFSQTPQSTPPPQPRPSPPAQQTPNPQPVRAIAVDPRRMQPFPLNPVAESDMLAARVVALQRIVAPLYRKPSGKELAGLSVSEANLQRYSAFLRTDDAGIFRLVPDTGCEHSERVISAREDCIKYSIPGAGNSYSFRTEGYRLRHLADVTYTNGLIKITGIYMHGLLADLGEVSIDSANLQMPGMKPLINFQPSTTADDVVQVDLVIERGLSDGKFKYSKQVVPRTGAVFAMRSVAYRGKVIRAAGGVRYNELDYDKRRDIVVVFQVVENDPVQGLTIIWRRLSENESPKIKMPDRDDEKNEAGEGN